MDSRLVTVIATLVMLVGSVANAEDFQQVMHAWCTQAGTWTGNIDVTSAEGKVQTLELVSRHECTEGDDHHIVRERFGSGHSTVKVTFVDRDAAVFHTAYFAQGKQAPYRFSFVGVELADDLHWKTIIESPPGTETYEGRPALLRYVRVRNGNTIESWKEVKFVGSAQDYELRSKIVQTLAR
jgi:hypothetical protein